MPLIAKTKFTSKLILFLRVIFIVLLSAFASYSAFVYMYLESVKSTNVESINKTISNYRYAVQYARTVASQIFTDSYKEQYLASNVDPVDRFFYYNRLKRYIITTPYLQSIDILHEGQAYHIGFELTDDDVYEFVNRYRENLEPVARKLTTINSEHVSEMGFNVYSLVYYESVSSGGTINDAVILNFEERWAEQFMGIENETQYTIITNSEGELLLATMPIETYEGWQEPLEKCMKNGKTFAKLEQLDGEQASYYVSQKYSDGKLFTIMTGENRFVKIFQRTLIMTILISSVFCVFIFIIAFSYSRYFLMIVRQVKQQLRQSEERFQNGREIMKSKYFLDILANEDYHAEEIQSKFIELGIEIKTDGGIRLFLIEIDHARAAGKTVYSMRKLKEIAEEMKKDKLFREWISVSDTQFLFITEGIEDSAAQTLAEKFQKRYLDETQRTISVFISRTGEFKDCVKLYQEVRAARKQKFICGLGCLIFARDKQTEEYVEIEVYNQYEQNITGAFRQGQVAKALEIFHAFLYSDFIRKNINSALELVQKMLFSCFLCLRMGKSMVGNVVFQEIDHVETVMEAQELLESMVKKTAHEKHKEDRGEIVVQETEDYIDRHYGNSNLSVSVIADCVGISSGYLGQIYKAKRKRSINDYINAKRMEQAKFLIENTDKTILEIAEKVGITNKAQLYKLFKKYYNATPMSFRK